METLIGFIGGVLTSWIFWKYLLFLKPKVGISPLVAKGISNDENKHDQTVYRIKVINFGNRQVINLHGRISLTKITEINGGKHRTARRIRTATISALGPRKAVDDLYGILPVWVIAFQTEEALENLINDRWKLQFTLSAQDALSGTTVVQTVIYDKHQIVNGNFRGGLSTELVRSFQEPAIEVHAEEETVDAPVISE